MRDESQNLAKRKPLIDHGVLCQPGEKAAVGLAVCGGVGNGLLLYAGIVSEVRLFFFFPPVALLAILVIGLLSEWHHSRRYANQPVYRATHCIIRAVLTMFVSIPITIVSLLVVILPTL